ncbi:MAG: DNA methyltransferase [Ignavibacteria bacterium]|jgi:tRNA G10  N-methylase Trm11|nr:DNA methyltransferase [Ignavibacteria bacterium]MDH7528665.1 DNA methyltransferase [Ignavibacteria bacterium]
MKKLRDKGNTMLERTEELLWAYQISVDELKKDLVLLDNVQFIYELSLAELELKSFGADFEITNGLREFKILNKNDELINLIKKRSAYFKLVFGELTDYFFIIQKNRTKSVNQYLTHWIYPYKGKFHPQMIRALINIIGLQSGDLLCDPFSGSGTTALEAQLLGVNFYGIDISPLCVLQGKVKTNSLFYLDKIKEYKNYILSKLNLNLFNNEKDFYAVINEIDDEEVKDFYKLARLVAISDNARRGKEFEKSFSKNLELMIASIEDYKNITSQLNLNLGKVNIEIGDARRIKLEDNSVDGIITSPPYSIALNYVENDEHSLVDLGYNVESLRNEFIGVRGNGKNKVDLYNADMKKAYTEFYRILKPNAYAVIVIGNATYQGKEIQSVEFTIDYMTSIGFSLERNILKLIFGLYNVMKKENILIFKKIK